MPPRDCRIRIAYIIDTIKRVARYTADQTRETFGSDEKTVDAVIRNVTIIGEAATHTPAEVEIRHSELP